MGKRDKGKGTTIGTFVAGDVITDGTTTTTTGPVIDGRSLPAGDVRVVDGVVYVGGKKIN